MPGKKKVKEPVLPKSDDAVAAEIEVKKTVRAAGRKTKEAAKDAELRIEDELKDAAVAAEIEVKKTTRKAARKVKETAEAVAKETKKAVRKAKLEVVIESPMGGAISTDEIAKKIPDGAEAVYVRVEQNKLYWVKGSESGSVDIW